MDVPFGQELGVWAYLLLALIVMVEGPVATLAGAVAASAGLMNPVWVFVAAATGDLVADTLWYSLGYMGKMEWLHRYGGWVGIRERHVTRFTQDVQRHATKILLIAKLTLGFSIPALVATGFARVPMRRWFFVLVLGETLWTGALVVLGFYFGKYVQQLERGVELVALVGGGIFLFLAFGYIARMRRQAAMGAEQENEAPVDEDAALEAELVEARPQAAESAGAKNAEPKSAAETKRE